MTDPVLTDSHTLTSARYTEFRMQQYYENNFKETIQEVGKFSAERSDGCCSDSDDLMAVPESENSGVGAEEKGEDEPIHIMSQSGKNMVDVPDPPMEEAEAEAEAETEAVSPVKKERKVQHLFVKVAPKRTAKFERMVRRHRSFEHEAKVYSELLHDLQMFVKARVGDTVELKIPTIDPDEEGSAGSYQEDSHTQVVEDLSQKGFQTKDWFKQKLDHAEVKLTVDELAKFHACGLAYRYVHTSIKGEVSS